MARYELEQRHSLFSISTSQENNIEFDFNCTEEYWEKVLTSRSRSTSSYEPRKVSTFTFKQKYKVNGEEATNNIVSEKARELQNSQELQSFFNSFSSDSQYITELINTQDVMQRTALHEVCEVNKESSLVFLLEHGGDPNLTDWRNQTPLHYAVQRGHFNLVKILVYFMHKKSLEIIDSSGKDVLLLSLAYSHIDIALFLLQFIGVHSPDINLHQFIHREDNEGNSVARLLKSSNYFDLFDTVWKNDEVDHIHHVHSLFSDQSSLWSSIINSSSINSPFWLTNFNIFPKIKSPSSNQFDSDILLLLKRLKRDYHTENIFVQFLLQQDLLSITPLHYIIKRASIKVLQYILTISATYKSHSIPEFANIIPLLFILLDYSKRSILHYCAQTGNEEILTLLLNHLQQHTHPDLFKKIINFPDINGNSPLLIAAQYHHWDLVQVFLQYNAIHKLSNDDQHTLYSLFVEFNQREKFRRYIDLFPDCDLSHAFFIACKNGNFDIFHYILAKKSREEIRCLLNKEFVYHSLLHPKLPVQIALENSHYTMAIYMLEEYYSSPSHHSINDQKSDDPFRKRLFKSLKRIQSIETKDEIEELLTICKYNPNTPLSMEESENVVQLMGRIISSSLFLSFNDKYKTSIIIKFLSILSSEVSHSVILLIMKVLLSLEITNIQSENNLFDYLRLALCIHYKGVPSLHNLVQWKTRDQQNNIKHYKVDDLFSNRKDENSIMKYNKVMQILINSNSLRYSMVMNNGSSLSNILSHSSPTNSQLLIILEKDLKMICFYGYWEINYYILRDIFHNNFSLFSSAFPFYCGFYYAIKHNNVGFIYRYCKEFLSESYKFSDSSLIPNRDIQNSCSYSYFKKLFNNLHSHPNQPFNRYCPKYKSEEEEEDYLIYDQYRCYRSKDTKTMNNVHGEMQEMEVNNEVYHHMNMKKEMVMLRFLQYACRRGNASSVFTLLLFTSQINAHLLVESKFVFNSSFLSKSFHYALDIENISDYQLELLKDNNNNNDEGESDLAGSFIHSIKSPLIVNHLINHWRIYLERVHSSSMTFLNYFVCLTDDFDLFQLYFKSNRFQNKFNENDNNENEHLSFDVLKLLISHTKEKVNISKGFFIVMNQYYLTTPQSNEHLCLLEKIKYLIHYISNHSIYINNQIIDLNNTNQVPSLLVQSLLLAAKKGDKKLLKLIIQTIKKDYKFVDWKRILTYRISEHVNYTLSYVNLFYYILHYQYNNLEKDSYLIMDYIYNEIKNSSNPSMTIRPCDLYTMKCTKSFNQKYLEYYSQSDTKAMWIAAAQSHYSLLSYAIDQSPSLSFDSNDSTFEQLNRNVTFIIDDYHDYNPSPQSDHNNNHNINNKININKKEIKSESKAKYQLEKIVKLLKEMGCKSKQLEEDGKIAAKKGYWSIALDLLNDPLFSLPNNHLNYYLSFVNFAIEQKNHVILTKLLFDCTFSAYFEFDLLYKVPRSHLMIVAMNPSLFHLFLNSPEKFDLTPLLFLSIFLTNNKQNYPHTQNAFEFLFFDNTYQNTNRHSFSSFIIDDYQSNNSVMSKKKLTRLVDKKGNTLLHIIAKYGNLSIYRSIEAFIEPTDYQIQNIDKHRPIEIACRSGNIEIALLLIDHYSIQRDFRDYRDKDGENILHHICLSGKKKILRKFHEICHFTFHLSSLVEEISHSLYNCLSYAYAMGHSFILPYFSSLYGNQNFNVIINDYTSDMNSLLSDTKNMTGFFSYLMKINQTPAPLPYHPSTLLIDNYLDYDYHPSASKDNKNNKSTKTNTTFLFEYTHKETDRLEVDWDEIKQYHTNLHFYSSNPLDFSTAISTNNLNLMRAFKRYGLMSIGPEYFLQTCSILGNRSMLEYAYSHHWFTISDLYYHPDDRVLRYTPYSLSQFNSHRSSYSSFNMNSNSPLFLSLIYQKRDVYCYFKELLKKETTLYHPSSIKELRDVDENYLIYWLIRNNWEEEYNEVLEFYHQSDPLDLIRLQLTSKSDENLFHIIYSTRNHPLQSHNLFQLSLLFPNRLPIFSDCIIFLSLLTEHTKVNDVITSVFNLNSYQQSGGKNKKYLVQFIDFLFEFLPLTFIPRSFYFTINKAELITSMRFNFNRNILHLILSNPTQMQKIRCKHARFCFKLNPQLLCEKDFNRVKPESEIETIGRREVISYLLQYHFVDVMLLPNLNDIGMFYCSPLLQNIVTAVRHLGTNFTVDNMEEYLLSTLNFFPLKFVKILLTKLNPSICSSVVNNL